MTVPCPRQPCCKAKINTKLQCLTVRLTLHSGQSVDYKAPLPTPLPLPLSTHIFAPPSPPITLVLCQRHLQSHCRKSSSSILPHMHKRTSAVPTVYVTTARNSNAIQITLCLSLRVRLPERLFRWQPCSHEELLKLSVEQEKCPRSSKPEYQERERGTLCTGTTTCT